ncbi:GntR family transcriptional regulator [Martelella sp. FOR1707]
MKDGQAIMVMSGNNGLSTLAEMQVTPFPERVVEMINDLIATGELRGGDRLTEKALSDVLGVSRTPLREAIKMLAARGLVRTRPNAGAVLSLPDAREAGELVEVMGWLWDKMAVQVVERITQAQLAEIQRYHEEMGRLCEAGDMLGWAKINRRFHEAIIEASNNAVLCEIAMNLQMRIYLCFAIGQRTRERQERSNAEHGEIIDIIRAGDGARLAQALMQHTSRAFETAYETGVIQSETGEVKR